MLISQLAMILISKWVPSIIPEVLYVSLCRVESIFQVSSCVLPSKEHNSSVKVTVVLKHLAAAMTSFS
jgi:hypothetical protein